MTHAQDLGPFAGFDTISAEIDAAAVFENPAERFLLGPGGRTMRSLLKTGGIFTQTELAFQALGRAFDAPVDDTIRSLLSRRVVVIWDGFEQGDHNLQGLTNSIDTRWALVCEVEPDYLQTIRAAMRPVKRDIVHGRPVYAIEQGRYRVVMLENRAQDALATVLLAPSNGFELLQSVLASLVQDQPASIPNASMIRGHEDMLAALSHEHSNSHPPAPTFAFMARSSTLISALLPNAKSGLMQEHAADSVLAAIVQFDEESLQCSFASDLAIDPALRDAPIALLDAVSQDSVFAIAASRAPRISLSGDTLLWGMKPRAAQDPSTAPPDPGRGESVPIDPRANEDIFNAPMLLSVVPLETENGADLIERLGLCLVIDNPKRGDGITASLIDEAMAQGIGSYDPHQAPEFRGRFPSVPRMVALRPRPAESDTDLATKSGSLERNPRAAWMTSSTKNRDLIIASIGPYGTDPIGYILGVEQTAYTLDALDAAHPSGVLLRVHILPSRALQLIEESDRVDIVMAKLVRELDIEVRRGLRTGLRGSIELDFSPLSGKPGLGAK